MTFKAAPAQQLVEAAELDFELGLQPPKTMAATFDE